MTTVSTVTATWSGFTGAPGFTRFNFMELADTGSCNAAGAAVKAFFDAHKNYMPNTWTIVTAPVVQHKDVATGDLTGETAMTTTPPTVTGLLSNTTVFTGGSGSVIDWITGAFWNGRKVRGRTFMVPMASCYSNDGTITPAYQTVSNNAGLALVNDPTTTLAVWAKKFDDSKPPKQLAGGLFAVTGTLVPDRSAQLRSRRS